MEGWKLQVVEGEEQEELMRGERAGRNVRALNWVRITPNSRYYIVSHSYSAFWSAIVHLL